MNDIVNYGGFLTACILLNLTPGSDTIYIMTRTIAEGKKSGIVATICHLKLRKYLFTVFITGINSARHKYRLVHHISDNSLPIGLFIKK